ncbi:hypothetical protein WHR41_07888 [Cladosporium halotolerans]|uniref:Uncharacterized protein n=1 Tax=Cladosporium halotolerans TaxID=1052096 RepID=A0AB34KHG6_9PEZI
MSHPERNLSYDKRENAPFKFINIEQPGDAAEKRTRRQVRSHVSRLQHRLHRERNRNTESLNKTDDANAQASSSAEVAHVNESSQKPPKSTTAPEATRVVFQTVNRSGDDRAINSLQRRNNGTTSLPQAPTTPLEKAFSRGEMAFRTITLDDPENVVGSNIGGLRLDISNLMHSYKMIVFIQAQDFDHHFGAVIPNVVSWERFYAFVFQDPIMISTALLLTARHFLETLGRPPQGKDLVHIRNLEQHLVRRINRALSDPRGISDHLLVAVSLCAAYDGKHGNPESYDIHMRGLVQMIKLRGGLPEVGRDPYVERLLLWQDANASKVTGGRKYFDGMTRSPGADFPKPNTEIFQMK